MNFFGKKNNKAAEGQGNTPVEPEVQDKVAEAAGDVTEKDVPQPAATHVQMPQHFLRRDPRILNPTQLQRVKDAKQLAETKLQGLEESLARLQAQMQWLRRFNETSMALQREKKRLFELGKQKAIMAKESSMLERYDLFEGIHGIYQKLGVVNEQIGRDKRGLSLLERESEANRQKLTDQEKRQQHQSEQYNNATANLLETIDRICRASRLDGEKDVLEEETTFLLDYNNKLKEEMNALSSLISEKERTVGMMRERLELLRNKRHSMEMHETMLLHGEAILLELHSLEDRDKRRAKLQEERKQAVKRQEEENELLEKAFAGYQQILSQAETAEAELNMHRTYIQGQDGLLLQERAMTLKSRRQMLLSALSLWKRISTGYENIEVKSRRVTQLRLEIQHLEEGVAQLEAESGKAHRLCKEKEYTYLLSKGQDIIQLRADLREGVSCSVCGATHHPYHSDTILDQSKLIGQMKTDYELLASEANAKQKQLTEMQMELAAKGGQLKAEEEALNSIRIRQNEDVQEWKLYSELDSTFDECSESTNADARTATLRQFIENVSRDAELAEKELETFSFHQSSIAKISEELQKLEQKKSEIGVRLGELNTGLQVLSREVEQIGTRLESITTQFTHTYENMQKAVTIKDWYTVWQKNPDRLYEQIQKLVGDWFSTETAISAEKAAFDVETARLEDMTTQLQSLGRISILIEKKVEEIDGRKAENRKTMDQTIPGNDAKTLYQRSLSSVTEARKGLDEEQNRMSDIRHDSDIMQGRHDFYKEHIERLEGEQKELGEKLDLWMHAFNLQHPPVQMSELDEVFADGKDWSRIRSDLKQIVTDTLLCGAKVEDLNSRLIALDTEDGRCNTSQPDIQENIAAKQQTLTKQRSETMMQIARLSVQLDDHEKALAAERNSEEKQYE